jgi:purine-binding chemotaxis protein CheW
MMNAMANAPVSETRRQVISFVLEPELMGFDLKYVEKVVEVDKYSFVPRAPAFVRGAINHHGKVIVVIDFREFVGMERVAPSLDSRILILASDVYHLGLLVDRVERIESVPLRGPLVQTPDPGETNPYVSKMINLGGRILNLIDVEKLLVEIENYFA